MSDDPDLFSDPSDYLADVRKARSSMEDNRLPAGHGITPAQAIMDLPVTPYAGTSGWSGTDTSRYATEYADTNGITADSQRAVLEYLYAARLNGATVVDLRAAYPRMHHGRVSGALSVLHMKGHIVMLATVRDRCHVYVAPPFTSGRDTVPHRSNKPAVCPHCGGAL
jgi:hypothetical protein